MEHSIVDQAKRNVETIKKFITPFFNLVVSTHVYGYHNIAPTGKLILTCNHRSDMDPFVIAAAFPRFISWIAAEYTTRIPLFRDLIASTGTIPMAIDGNITLASIKKVQQVFKNGDVLGIFPEGHDFMVQNDFTAPLAKFHPGFAMFSLRNKVDVLPSVIIPEEETITDYPVPPLVRAFMGMPKEVCNIKKRVVYKKVNLVFGEIIKYSDYAHLPLDAGVAAVAAEVKKRIGDLQNANFLLKS